MTDEQRLLAGFGEGTIGAISRDVIRDLADSA
jgi:hypothetical protein